MEKRGSGVKKRAETKAANCSFCGKSKQDVRKLISGPGVNICNECVQAIVQRLPFRLDVHRESDAAKTKASIARIRELLELAESIAGGKDFVPEALLREGPLRSLIDAHNYSMRELYTELEEKLGPDPELQADVAKFSDLGLSQFDDEAPAWVKAFDAWHQLNHDTNQVVDYLREYLERGHTRSEIAAYCDSDLESDLDVTWLKKGTAPDPPGPASCAFCGKKHDEVEGMVAAASRLMCIECVSLCVEITGGFLGFERIPICAFCGERTRSAYAPLEEGAHVCERCLAVYRAALKHRE